MNRQAERAKTKLNEAGFELVSSFVVQGGMATSFDGTREVPETDAAYLWVREDDERGDLHARVQARHGKGGVQLVEGLPLINY